MCDFPLVRDRFWPPAPGEDSLASRKLVSSAPSSPTKEAASGRMGGLRALDLRGLPHAEGPPTELRVKKDKLAFFERQCTPVGEGLYVGAEAVAKSREALREAGIARVVNCVGFLYPAYFEDEMPYKTLHLQGARGGGGAVLSWRSSIGTTRPDTAATACLPADTPGEDILCVLYDVFDFIEACGLDLGAREEGPAQAALAQRARGRTAAAPAWRHQPPSLLAHAGGTRRARAGALQPGRLPVRQPGDCLPHVEAWRRL